MFKVKLILPLKHKIKNMYDKFIKVLVEKGNQLINPLTSYFETKSHIN